MDRAQAVALVMYVQRAYQMIPTTGAEWDALSPAMRTIEGVANGVLRVDVKPAAAQLADEKPEQAAAQKPAV